MKRSHGALLAVWTCLLSTACGSPHEGAPQEATRATPSAPQELSPEEPRASGPIEVNPGEALQHETPDVEGFPIGFAQEEDTLRLSASEPALMAAAATDGGVIELEPNVINGTAKLTNQNPEILALLEADPWHVSGTSTNSNTASVTATSTKPGGYSATTSTTQFKSPSEYDFTMLVESSAGEPRASSTTSPARSRHLATRVPPRPRGSWSGLADTAPNPTGLRIHGLRRRHPVRVRHG